MGCRKERLGEDANRAAVAASVSDALLFATMCIIGLPVDVHAKDGSVYSGIFQTACVDNDYAIVLKKARMIKRGNCSTNVMNGNLIETLIVQSEDLVQVVAKGVPLPANGITGYGRGDGVENIADDSESLKGEVKVIGSNKSHAHNKHRSQTRSSAKMENGSDCLSITNKAKLGISVQGLKGQPDDSDLAETREALAISVDGRLVDNGLREKQSDCRDKPEFPDEKTSHEVRGLSLTYACEVRSSAAESVPDVTTMQRTQGVASEAPASDVALAATPVVNVTSESLYSSLSTSSQSVPPKCSSINRTAKESKLNPGAKIFSPSFVHHRSATPPAMPTGAGVAYLSDNNAGVPIATAQQEVDISSYVPRSSVPIKFVPCSNVVIGNGSSETPYVQPIIGQVVSRTQPVRYAAQYHNLQARPAYVHPNSQNVMVGRVGPLVCMHPISNDVVPGAAGFSQATIRPLLTPHSLPKHQGSATAQALQLCMNPSIIASGQQPYAMPNPIPISQPFFPVLQHIPVPGSNGFLGTKFA